MTRKLTTKLNVILIMSILVFIQNVDGQAPDTLWTKTFGGSSLDWGYSVQQTSDSGYIIAGRTASFGAGLGDVWLIKTDANGDTMWTKIFGGSYLDWGKSVQQTSDGGYIIVGETFSYGLSGDVWLIKTDSNGNVMWTKTFGGSNTDGGKFVQQTSDGGYIITGYTYSFSAGLSDFWLIKTDTNGNTLWTKTFGGNDYDEGYFVQQTFDGGYIITGYTYSFGAGSYDVWLIKTDANGDSLWAKTFGGSEGDAAYSVHQTSDGGYIIIGSTISFGAGGYDAWLIKTSLDGDSLWTKTFGGNDDDWGYSIQQTTDSGYIIAGWTYSFGIGNDDVWLIKTDANGDTMWTKTFGGSNADWAYSVQRTSDGGYIITGVTESFGAGYGDVWLIKVAPDITSIDERRYTVLNGYRLQQNYPNPFNPITHIRFRLPRSSHVKIEVFNILGEKVTTLLDAHKTAGYHVVDFDGSNLASGVYLYKIQAGEFVDVKKMILMK